MPKWGDIEEVMRLSVVFNDHSREVSAAFGRAKEAALEAIGLTAEGYAQGVCPSDTGALRSSISHAVEGNEVYIGTNMEYAAFVELGTGKYYPGGRQTPWVYEDRNGRMHRTSGIKARPYLRPAVAEHGSTYRRILENAFRNG